MPYQLVIPFDAQQPDTELLRSALQLAMQPQGLPPPPIGVEVELEMTVELATAGAAVLAVHLPSGLEPLQPGRPLTKSTNARPNQRCCYTR